MKYSFTICKYLEISSRNTAMPESNILENKLFMVPMNMVGIFASPMGVTTHSYGPYLVRNAVFGISSSAIQHCQYPLQGSIDMIYFTLPIKSRKSLHSGNGYKSLIISLLST